MADIPTSNPWFSCKTKVHRPWSSLSIRTCPPQSSHAAEEGSITKCAWPSSVFSTWTPMLATEAWVEGTIRLSQESCCQTTKWWGQSSDQDSIAWSKTVWESPFAKWIRQRWLNSANSCKEDINNSVNNINRVNRVWCRAKDLHTCWQLVAKARRRSW